MYEKYTSLECAMLTLFITKPIVQNHDSILIEPRVFTQCMFQYCTYPKVNTDYIHV